MGDITAEFVAALSAETGVPVEFLCGETTLDMWESAQRLVDWKAKTTAPQPTPNLPTSAVSASSVPYEPITAQGCAPDGDYLAAWRAGKLAPAGVPAPPQRAPRGRRGMPW